MRGEQKKEFTSKGEKALLIGPMAQAGSYRRNAMKFYAIFGAEGSPEYLKLSMKLPKSWVSKPVSEVLTLCRVVAMRALARFKRAQRSINALYEPPAWQLVNQR